MLESHSAFITEERVIPPHVPVRLPSVSSEASLHFPGSVAERTGRVGPGALWSSQANNFFVFHFPTSAHDIGLCAR